jgi:UDP-N-acetylglucosamine:LPS N-acetylglucosamine transferase
MHPEPRKKILVTPLNYGLGYATRCIPIIEALENQDFEPIIASDGAALQLLKKEFPHLTALPLPAYQPEYTNKDAFLGLKTLFQLAGMFRAISREQRAVKQLVAEHNIHGIVADTRLGAYCKGIPSVFITHHVNVLCGNATEIASRMHRRFFKNFTQCWVPDVKNSPNLSGKMGHTEEIIPNLKYIGTLSRLHKINAEEKKYDLAVILSGAEPYRTQLEEKLSTELEKFDGTVVVIRGVMENAQHISYNGHITTYNYMDSAGLEETLNRSELILCRPGYSNIMDLAKLCKKAFFIPTPDSEEQEYLAKRLKKANLAPSAKQHNFKISDLEKAKMYKGLRDINGLGKWKDLFSLFEGKGEL